MNTIRSAAFTFLRTYVTRSSRPVAGVRGKLLTANVEETKLDSEDFDYDDLDEFGSDFMHVDKSHRENESELRRHRKKIENVIAIRKDFKEAEPSFLTFIEKDQIRKLHESDPEYWTVEKLSDSFPALPHIIQKVLKSKWVPESVDRALTYDKQVAQNWEKFRNGDISLSPELTKHLTKFQGRKIVLADRDELAKYIITPEEELPKPKSTMFRNILHASLESRGYNERDSIPSERNLDTKKMIRHNYKEADEWFKDVEFNDADKPVTYREFTQNKLLEYYETSPEKAITLMYSYKQYLKAYKSRCNTSNVQIDASINDTVKVNAENDATVNTSLEQSSNSELEKDADTILMEQNNNTEVIQYYNKYARTKTSRPVTFKEFVKENLETICKTSPEEGVVLLDTYRKQVEVANVEKTNSNLLNHSERRDEKNIPTVEEPFNENGVAIVEAESQNSEIAVEIDLKHTSIATMETLAKELLLGPILYEDRFKKYRTHRTQ